MNHSSPHGNGLLNCTTGKPLSMLTTPTFVALNANQTANNILQNLQNSATNHQTSFFTTNPSFMTTQPTASPQLFQHQPGPNNSTNGTRPTNAFNPASLGNLLPYGLAPQFTQNQVSFNGQNGPNHPTLLFTSPASQHSTFSPINLANLAASFANGNKQTVSSSSPVVTTPSNPINSTGLTFTPKLNTSNLPILLPAQGTLPFLSTSGSNQNVSSPNPPQNLSVNPKLSPMINNASSMTSSSQDNNPKSVKSEDLRSEIKEESPGPVQSIPNQGSTTVKLEEIKPKPFVIPPVTKTEERPPATHRFTSKIEDDPEEVLKYSEEILEKSEYFKNRVLECIDKLKERKARPDMERIGCLMKRQFNIPHKVTHKCLERLAEVGSIVCVDYKGHISYRNPAKWRRTSISNGVTNPTHISKLLVDSVRNLCEKHKNSHITDANGMLLPPPTAFTLTEIEHMLLTMEKIPQDPNECSSPEEFSEQRRNFYDQFMPSLRLCVEREVLTGGLNKNIEGKYIVDESGDKKRAYAALLFNKKSIPKSMLGRPRNSMISRPPLKTYGPHLPSSNNVTNPNFNMKPIASKPPISGSNNTQSTTNNLVFVTPKDSSVGSTNGKSTVGPSKRGRPTNKMRAKMQEENGVTENKIKPILPNTCHSNSTVFTTLSINPNGIYQPTFFQKPINPGTPQQVLTSNGTDSTPNLPKTIPPFIPNSSQKCFKCNENFKDGEEPFTALQCMDCKNNAHAVCLDFWPELSKRASECGWQCPDCKSCIICRNKNQDNLKICDNCDQAFHPLCHQPMPISETDPSSAWVCSLCLNAGFTLDVTSQQNTSKTTETVEKVECTSDKENNYPVIHSVMPNCGSSTTEPEVVCKKRSSAPLTETKANDLNETEKPSPAKLPKIEPEVVVKKEEETFELPNEVNKWSVKHVHSWLQTQGYPKEAESFCNEEIDGACLLLMKKMDILTDLGIKLGPAVKIFEKIKSLQTAR